MRILRLLATCLIFVCLTAAAFAEKFTIAAIPDTQGYVDEASPQPASTNIFIAETQFLANNKNTMNIVFTSHLGDLVQSNDRYPTEWARARLAIDVLHNAGMTFGMVPGNHDVSVPITNELWLPNFGPSSSYFAGKSWYGGSNTDPSFGDSAGMSSWQTFTAGGRTFLHISIQNGVSDAVLAWAQTVIDAHPGTPVIVSAHTYMYHNGTYYTSGQLIWDKLLKVNPEIFMLICGHDGPTHRRADNNLYGQPVYQVMSDYQGAYSGPPGNLGGGGGWVRLMEFDTELNQIAFRTWSVLLNKYSNDPVLIDGTSYARNWAWFNYSNAPGGSLGDGPLYPLDGPYSSDFVYSFNFNSRWTLPTIIRHNLTTRTNTPLVGPATPTSTMSVRRGAVYTITAPATFPFNGWTASPSTAATFSNASAPTTTVILTGNCTVTANYPELSILTMAVTPAGAGTLSPAAGTTVIVKNQPQAISTAALPGYTFLHWSASPAGSASFGSANAQATTVTLSGDCTVTANYEPSFPLTLTLAASLPGGGVLTPAAGTHTVIRHEPQSISTTVNPDHAFTGWTATPPQNASFLNAGVTSTTVTLTAPCTVTANFAETVRLNMAVSPVGGGSIQPSVNLTHTVFKGAAMTLFVQSTAPGYRFLNWVANPSGNASFDNAFSTLTTATVTGHCTITARFANYVLGDLSGDGIFNVQDIAAFKTALADKAAWESATGRDADQLGDFNGDGVFNALDIPGFKAASGY